MKRRAICRAVMAAILAGTFAIWYLFIRDGVTLDNYTCIKMEMTKSEIQMLLRGPLRGPDESVRLPKERVRETWTGTKGTITLYFDENDRLFWLEWTDSSRGIRE